MKAVVYRRYGSADVLDLCEHDPPGVDDGHVLVRVHAASRSEPDDLSCPRVLVTTPWPDRSAAHPPRAGAKVRWRACRVAS